MCVIPVSCKGLGQDGAGHVLVEGGSGGEVKEGAAGQVHKKADGTMWKLMWVQVAADEQPQQPLTVKASLYATPPSLLKATAKARAVPNTPQPATIAPATPQPQASSSTPQHQAAPGTPVTDLQDFLRQVLTGMGKPAGRSSDNSELEEPGPKLTITEEAQAWQLSQRGDVQRMKWPLASNSEVPLDRFKLYLDTTIGQVPDSVEQNIRCIRYVYGMFDLPSSFSVEGFWASLYSSGLAEEWAALPIMSSKIPNVSNISNALDHYVEHLLIQAERKRHTEATRNLRLLKTEVLKPLSRRTTKAKNQQNVANRGRDATKLAKLPPQDVLKKAIHDTMVCLHWLHHGMHQHKIDPSCPQLKGAANTLMVGLVFANSYAGRPGEWSVCRRDAIQAVVDEEADHIRMNVHKTSTKYGPAGRPIPAGNLEGMKKVLGIHPSEACLFFDPRKKSTKVVSINSLLEKWAHTFTPGFEEVGATLQRKLFHTASKKKDVAEQVFEQFCALDKHKTSTGDRNYVAADLAMEAMKGAAVYKEVLGPPVEWPSKEELKAGRKQAIQTLGDLYTRVRKTNPENEEEDEEEAEEGEAAGAGEEEVVGAAGSGQAGVVASGEAEDADQRVCGTGEAKGAVVQELEEEGSTGGHNLSPEEQAWAMGQFTKLREKKGLPIGMVPKYAFFEALKLVGQSHKMLADSVTADDLEAFIKAEQLKVLPPATPASPPQALTPSAPTCIPEEAPQAPAPSSPAGIPQDAPQAPTPSTPTGIPQEATTTPSQGSRKTSLEAEEQGEAKDAQEKKRKAEEEEKVKGVSSAAEPRKRRKISQEL